MKNVVLVPMLLCFFACQGDKRGTSQSQSSTEPVPNPVVQLPSDANTVVTGTIAEPERSYDGRLLKLGALSGRSLLGSVHLSNQDARVVFDMLAYTPVVVVANNRQVLFKTGEHITCSTTACSLAIDALDGIVLPNQSTGQKVRKVPGVMAYKSPDLELKVVKKRATITLSGADAQALYQAMAVPETTGGTRSARRLIKQGEHIVCEASLESGSTDTHLCRLNFRYSDGQVIKP
jgi:hypothetical protein